MEIRRQNAKFAVVALAKNAIGKLRYGSFPIGKMSNGEVKIIRHVKISGRRAPGDSEVNNEHVLIYL